MLKYLATVLLAATAAFADIEKEDGVLVLGDDTLDNAVKENEHILVEFYAPWCGHCKSLAGPYSEAAKYFEESEEVDVVLAKVDATEHTKSASAHNVAGYPTLKFFKNGVVQEYNGGRTKDEIISWLLKKTGPATVTVEDDAALKALQEENDVVVVLATSDASEDNKAFANFVKVANGMDDAVFAVTSDFSLVDLEAGDDQIVLLKDYDEKRVVYEGKITKTKLTNFITPNLLPYVVEFNDAVAAKVFGGKLKEHILYFRDALDEGDEAILEGYRNVAKKHQNELLFIAVDTNVESNSRITEYFGIKSFPALRIININDAPIKYQPKDYDNSEEGIEAFVSSYLADELSPSLNSEEVPANWDEDDVKIIVGKNFDEVVLDETKNVFLMAHAPWCGHCKSLMPVWTELAETFEEDDSVIIAKMDATANEVKHFTAQSFPTLKFFPANGKPMLDYDGERDLESLTTYVNENSVPVEGSAETDNAKDEL